MKYLLLWIAITGALASLFLATGGSYLRSTSALPPALIELKGRVLTPAQKCQGSKGWPRTFTLVLQQEKEEKAYHIFCNEPVRSTAVGGTEVQLLVERKMMRNKSEYFEVWNAIVDGRGVVQYADVLSAHQSSLEHEPIVKAAFTVALSAIIAIPVGLFLFLRRRSKA